MNAMLTAVIHGALAGAIAAGAGASAAEMALLPVTVRDSGGRFVTGLKQTNFRLMQNGMRRDIALFASSDAPLSLAIVFDVARDAHVESARRALAQSMELMKYGNQGSEFVVVRPHNRAEPAAGFTTDGVAALGALRAVSGRARSGLPEAIGVASVRVKSARNAHRAILVISDAAPGAYSSNIGMTAPVSLAVGLPDTAAGSPAAPPPCPEAAARIAEQHGGVCLAGRGPAELRSAILDIVAELSNQYVLGYKADAGGGIDLELLLPRSMPKLDVSFRKPYRISGTGYETPKLRE